MWTTTTSTLFLQVHQANCPQNYWQCFMASFSHWRKHISLSSVEKSNWLQAWVCLAVSENNYSINQIPSLFSLCCMFFCACFVSSIFPCCSQLLEFKKIKKDAELSRWCLLTGLLKCICSIFSFFVPLKCDRSSNMFWY